MGFVEKNELKYYMFELLEFKDLIQGIFCRRGGVSPMPWSSLNLGGTVGDIKENVIENRKRIFDQINRPVASIFDVWQVHGKRVICTTTSRPLNTVHQRADAIVTDRGEVTLLMLFADCVPIFLYDPIKKVVGIAHAGWQGTVKKIGQEAVEVMCSQYGCNPADIHAGIGPSIGPDHYEIREDVASRVKTAFGADENCLLHRANGKLYFDLWAANSLVLQQAGVKHIQISNVCTACNIEDWYSHRGEAGKTGRFGAILSLKESK